MYSEFPLDDHESLFKTTGNPLYAWHKIHECYLNNKAFPDWVVNYLGGTAQRLNSINKPSGKGNREIIKALGIQDTSIFSKQDDDLFEFKYDVYKEMIRRKATGTRRKQGETEEDKLAEELSKSNETIDNWCKEIKTWIDKLNLPLLPDFEEQMIQDTLEIIREGRTKKRMIINKIYYKNLNYEYQAPVPLSVIRECYEKALVLHEKGGNQV